MAMKADQRDPSKRVCDTCASAERWFLHHVRHKGSYKRLCTHCVLRSFPERFCPICLAYFEADLPQRERVTCLRCPSVSHSACVSATSSFHGFQCPPCAKPAFSFFNPNRQNDGDGGAKPTLVIDRDSAKSLVVAARIAADSLAKAAALAREDAERRVRDAVMARKKAREALEKLTSLVNKQKELDLNAGDGGGGGGVVSAAPERVDAKPKSEGPGGIIQVAPKIGEPEGSNGLPLKINHGDPMEEG